MKYDRAAGIEKASERGEMRCLKYEYQLFIYTTTSLTIKRVNYGLFVFLLLYSYYLLHLVNEFIACQRISETAHFSSNFI